MDIISKRPLNIEAFKLFGSAHIMTVLVMVGVFSLLILISVKHEKVSKIFKSYLLYSLIIQEVVYRIWAGFYQSSDWSVVFSLHLSSISVLLCIFLLIQYKQSVFDIMYFWGLVAVPQAIITPGIIPYGFPHLRFFHLFSVHISTIFVVLYFLLVEKKSIRKNALFKVIVVTNLYGIFVFIINMIYDTNYMFIGKKSAFSPILNSLGDWPYFIIKMDMIAIVLFTLAYLPMKKRVIK